MATNLVSDIGEVLGPQIVSRIASSLGLDKTVVQGAVEGGVPGLRHRYPRWCDQFGHETRISDRTEINPLALAVGCSRRDWARRLRLAFDVWPARRRPQDGCGGTIPG